MGPITEALPRCGIVAVSRYVRGEMGRGESDNAALRSANTLFARRHRRGAANTIVSGHRQSALERIQADDGEAARRMLADPSLDPAWRQRFLEELANHEARSAYSRLGASADPEHPEYELILAAAKDQLARDPSSPAAELLAAHPPVEVWTCEPAGPLARQHADGMNIKRLSDAHLEALSRCPNSLLAEVACEKAYESFEEHWRDLLGELGLDHGGHMWAARVPLLGRRRLHIFAAVGGGEDGALLCAVRNNVPFRVEGQRVLREELDFKGPITDHPDVCPHCADLAREHDSPTADERPPKPVFGKREKAVREALAAGLDEAVAKLNEGTSRDLYRKLRWVLRRELGKELTRMLRGRLKEEQATLAGIPGGVKLAQTYGDLPLHELLGRKQLRYAVEYFCSYLEPDLFCEYIYRRCYPRRI